MVVTGSIHEERLINALSLIIKFLLARKEKGGLGLTQPEIQEQSGISQSDVSRVKLGQRLATPRTRALLARFLGIEETYFESRLQLFSAGLIPFSEVAPEVAALFPDELKKMPLVEPGIDRLVDSLENFTTPELLRLSSRAILISEGRAMARESSSFAQKLLEEYGRDEFKRIFSLTEEQITLIENGQIPGGLNRHQASILFRDCPFLDINSLPDPEPDAD